ncbi:MAG: DUF3137 domain-containing protein [Bdellovibrionales bacterium]|jgi:hypothetical protein|nr:DUF3137 domain-containing protein [Bdellovibrionales bacterium]
MATLEELTARLRSLDAYCHEHLWPEVESFESQTRVNYEPFKRRLKSALPWLAGGWLWGVFLPNSIARSSSLPNIILQHLSLVAIGIGVVLLAPEFIKLSQQLRDRFKARRALQNKIKERALAYFDPKLKFEPQVAFPQGLYTLCGLFPEKYDEASADERISSVLGETKYEMTEIATYRRETRTNGKGQVEVRMVPVFKGLLVRADFNKNFGSFTTVRTDQLERRLGGIGRTLQNLLPTQGLGTGGRAPGMKLVELENAEFEERFKVASTDPIEARYILTPSFMESVLSVQRKYPGIQLSFRAGDIVIAVPHPHDFMNNSLDLRNLTEAVRKMLEELHTALSLLEDLKLNDRIWNKRAGA